MIYSDFEVIYLNTSRCWIISIQ